MDSYTTLQWGPKHPLFASYESSSAAVLDLKNLDNHAEEERVRFAGIVRDMMDLEICEIGGVQYDRLPLICDALPSETYWATASRKRRVGEEKKPAPPSDTVIVYLYGGSDSARIKINDMIEVFGKFNAPLSLSEDCVASTFGEVKLAKEYDEDDGFDDMEDFSRSLINSYPQIDCQSFLILGPAYPLLMAVSASPEYSKSSSSSSSSASKSVSEMQDDNKEESDDSAVDFFHMGRQQDPFRADPKRFDHRAFVSSASAHMREAAINELRIAYGGDLLCAQYTLLALVSKIYDRPVDVGFLGAVTLNISAFDRISVLFETLSRLVPRIAHSVVNIETLNDKLWMPTKDYKHNCLMPSPLQLPVGTIALIDETSMKEGKLTQQGLKSIKALEKVANSRVLPIDYSFYELDIPIDFIPIYFSNGTSLCCKNNALKIVQTDDLSFISQANRPLLEDGLDNLRLWLATVRELRPSMSPEAAVLVEQSFVEARNRDCETRIDDLHCWLTVARLVAISHGSEVITCEHWTAMKEMEAQRLARLN